MKRDVVGVVLAGGTSRRMGRDKALLEIEGSALVDRAAAVLAVFCEPVVLSVAPGRRYPKSPFLPVEDERDDSGPLAGFEAVLDWARPRAVLVLACDLPRIDEPVVERLLRAREQEGPTSGVEAWVACRGERLQPLCGLYESSCLAAFRNQLDRGELSVLTAVEALDCHYVPYDDIHPDPFLNLNTPADYARAGSEVVAR